MVCRPYLIGSFDIVQRKLDQIYLRAEKVGWIAVSKNQISAMLRKTPFGFF